MKFEIKELDKKEKNIVEINILFLEEINLQEMKDKNDCNIRRKTDFYKTL